MSSDGRMILEARGVHVVFGGVSALSGVDLSVGRREVVGLIGPNGAGKTTMVNVLSGFQRPTGGAVHLGAMELTRMQPRDVARAGVARSFQAGRLFRDLTVAENLAVAGIGIGLSKRGAQRQALEILDWAGSRQIADKRCSSLSYGDERRVGIARALALRPAFLLLDEPASGMNEAECEALVKVIAAIPGEFGCGILLIEHNMAVLMGLCNRVHVLDGGRSLAEGTPLEVQRNREVRRAYLGNKAVHDEVAI